MINQDLVKEKGINDEESNFLEFLKAKMKSLLRTSKENLLKISKLEQRTAEPQERSENDSTKTNSSGMEDDNMENTPVVSQDVTKEYSECGGILTKKH